MSNSSLLRLAVRSSSPLVRSSYSARRFPRAPTSSVSVAGSGLCSPFSGSGKKLSDHDAHHEESFEEFSARYEKEFEGVQDVFELQVLSSTHDQA